ncbi:MAG TPA: hypothetical protein VGE66_11365 [Chitinophagaceae bacterium]
MLYILSIALVLVVFALLYSIYKSKTYKKPTQIITALTGAVILVLLLYTCRSDW